MQGEVLLEVKELRTWFPIRQGIIRRKTGDIKAVDGVSLRILKGETFGLVGESGCGKSTLGRSILRLIEPTGGEILFDGQDVRACSSSELRALRKRTQIVFQDPYASLNPRMTVRDIIWEPLNIHEPGIFREELDQRVCGVLELVGLEQNAMLKYPHEFSGGQRQRISIARALILNPDFLFFDEPVSALDVSVRSQVLNLIQELQKSRNLTYLFISHDLSVVKHISDRVGVMYLGELVEVAPKQMLFENPLHPYTQALMSAIPIPDPRVRVNRVSLSGDVPSPADPPAGCRFHVRCPYAVESCGLADTRPGLVELEKDHFVACIRAGAL